MAATTKTYKDGLGSNFTGREWDDGTANSAVTIIGDGLGGMLPKAEDAAAVSGDVGIPILGVRRDTAASSSTTDGDYSTFNFDSTGHLWAKSAIDQTTPGTTDRVTVGGLTLIDVTLTLDTSAYASGDLLADTQAVASAVRVNDGKGILHSVTIIDEDDQGVAMDIYFLSANNTLGSENAAPSISDANARDILCRVSVAAADYTDLGGVRIADIHGLNRIIKGASASTSIYVAVVNGPSAPTFTASGLKLRIGILQD